jgi:hypothetical protein
MVASAVLATVTRLEYVNVVTKMRNLLFNVYTDLYDNANVTGKRNAQASEMRTFAKTYLYT